MKNLLLLHGAIGASDQLLPLKEKLAAGFENHLFDFPGHGGKALPGEGFSIDHFAKSVLQWMDEQQFPSIDIFGYSMGGYVGLYLARHYPERVNRVFTLATKFAWDEATAAKEVKMLDPEKIAEKVPKFAQALEKRHAPQDWKLVLRETAAMMQQLGKSPALTDDDFRAIEKPVSIGIGDRDTMVSLEETIHVYRQLPGAELRVFARTPHPVEQVNVDQLADAIGDFFNRAD
ncbi:MAG: alpha/beta hydrolase [Bacteroidetes bacterium]|nr:MAG: alpha/beta hydrolase [Bacteroidota bacterium]